MDKIRITAVSYLNTKPFIYGIFRSELADLVDLQLDIPSECARKLASGEADLALAPVAVIPQLEVAYLISDFCIGSTQAVKTVCIYSDVPLEKIEKLYLDFHSKTSVELTKLLCHAYWNIQPEFLQATPGFEDKMKGTTAGLIIGDRAIGQENRFKYTYDLAETWTKWTGLPFVFAAWVSNKPLNPDFIQKFNAALLGGIEHIPELIKILPSMSGFDLNDYYKNCISYDLDESKWIALNRFLNHIAPQGYHLKRAEVLKTLETA